MHKYLIEAASPTQLKNFVDNALSMLKETNPDTYNTLENYLYKEIYGYLLYCYDDKCHNQLIYLL